MTYTLTGAYPRHRCAILAPPFSRSTSLFPGETACPFHEPARAAQRTTRRHAVSSPDIAALPSGTEDIYKIYAESFKGEDHLKSVQAAAKDVVDAALSE